MPQTASNFTVGPVNVTGNQVPFQLGAGNLVSIGSPGGPVIFTHYGALVVPSLFGSAPASVVGDRQA